MATLNQVELQKQSIQVAQDLILVTLKEELAKTLGIKKITLAVNKINKQGIKSFSKFM